MLTRASVRAPPHAAVPHRRAAQHAASHAAAPHASPAPHRARLRCHRCAAHVAAASSSPHAAPERSDADASASRALTPPQSRCAQPALWGPRAAGSHPAAFDDDPPFAALPQLNDASLRARLGLGPRVAAGRAPPRTRCRLVADAAAAAFPGEHPYERLARAVAQRAAIDVKEFVEALELFHRVRRRVRRPVIVDLACGHGLVGLLFGAFERRVERVLLLDARRPASHDALLAAAATIAPWLPAKVTFLTADITRLPGAADAAFAAGAELGAERAFRRHNSVAEGDADCIEDDENDHAGLASAADTAAAAAALVALPRGGAGFVALHACGSLTDACLAVAAAAGGPVAALPCCFTGTAAGAPPALRRALGVSLAADVARVYRLESAGYAADFASIPRAITPMNRAIVAVPRREGHQAE